MAWNSFDNKSAQDGLQTKSILNAGAPVAFNSAAAGKPYKDSWDIERAYREGLQKVTWVFRCIDAIAGNQARLPMVLREDNSPNGKIAGKNHALMDILNSKSNMGENSFIFRYRLSSQLLMSTRGVFIEKVRGRDGAINALHLLPPQHTAPIPDAKTFVSGYEVDMRNGTKILLKPDDVIWIRRPHPLDPYLSITPMESAGIAIEIENLAKQYNRNYLINDGRPGGLLVVRGEMDDDDKDELRNRFRGNIGRAGATTVISSDDGVDFVDTSASPRDAAYMQMRQITKEEILASFGVPESVIGNAAGRTFSNASEELRVFWMETMLPHLEPLARGLDDLDEKFYIDFDTSEVPILIVAKQERARYLMDEFQQGLISVNEYRDGTGKKKVDSELADSLLQNPNQTPIANTEKPFKPEQQVPVDTPVAPAGQELPAAAGPPGLGVTSPEMPAAPEAPASLENVAPPVNTLSAESLEMETKTVIPQYDDWDTKAEQDSDRWTEILDRALERVYERQQRVVIEKATGVKARKALAGKGIDASSIFDIDSWDKQIQEDIMPVLRSVAIDAVSLMSQKNGIPSEVDENELNAIIQDQTDRVKKANGTTKEEIVAALLIVMAMSEDEDRAGMLRAALAAIFANLMGRRKRVIAEQEAQTAHNAGVFLSAANDSDLTKTWMTRRDSKVRSAHLLLQGKTIGLNEGFATGGASLRFPGDPLAPIELTINCRCRLRVG
jgi:HK97 family phage portal protein